MYKINRLIQTILVKKTSLYITVITWSTILNMNVWTEIIQWKEGI